VSSTRGDIPPVSQHAQRKGHDRDEHGAGPHGPPIASPVDPGLPL